MAAWTEGEAPLLWDLDPLEEPVRPAFPHWLVARANLLRVLAHPEVGLQCNPGIFPEEGQGPDGVLRR